MMRMLQFEVEKVFCKFKNKAAIFLLLILLIATSFLTMNRVEYRDAESGNAVSGIAAARKLRAERNKWAGYLTGDVLAEVVRENTRINLTPEAQSQDIQEQDKAYAQKQGISVINELINNAFSKWRDYNYFAVDSVSEEEAKQVYERRISSLKEYLDSGEETFPETQKKFLIQRYENLKTPFYYEYTEGWSALLQNISTFILMLALGADGAKCPIQLDLWRSSYNITFFEAYLLIAAGGYVGTLFAAIVSMIVSAATRSTMTAVIVPFLILCAFPFLSRIITLPGICSFFPDQLLEVYLNIKEFNLVEFGGRVMSVSTVIIPFYLFVSLILLPMLYGVYKKAEIK